MGKKPFVSPFSLGRHEWSVKWNVMSDRIINRDMQRRMEKEEHILRHLKIFQVITQKQLRNRFKAGEKQIENMVRKKLLVKHCLLKNGQEWLIYTLANTSNYWLGYETEDVLKRLVGVDFYYELNQKLPFELKLLASIQPFVYQIEMNEHVYEVYIDRGDTSELLHFIERYQSVCKERRLFIVAEKINHLNGLLMALKTNDIKVRAVTDSQLYEQVCGFGFYGLNEGGWVLSK
ncbi:hypothetical protein AAGS61_17800 [Lysinibacillus sp. KU-BSD001]|uniref:hypothetical protein n=1 Tax=Lysinibacillus sp. KU-BSD001 TaxID=3141328 RepID=UPI0036E5EB53